jgi:DNA-directed RNA polymerase subunit RPC12/RpoP
LAEEEFEASLMEQEAGREEERATIIYVCAGCGREYDYREIVGESSIGLKCVKCGSRIFYKPRPTRSKPRKVYAV